MSGKGLPILVVEDDTSLRRVLVGVLGREGYRPLEAADGDQGFGVFQRERPPIVVTDVRLPGIDGLEVLKRIKKVSPETFVIISTGYGSEEIAIEALRSGASNYFVKPFTIHEFTYAVGVLADLSRQRPGTEIIRHALSGERRVFVTDGEIDRVNALVQELTRTAACFDTDVEAVRIGLLEMITNAVEHGSLMISREEKLEALRAGKLAELYRERAASDACRGRKVTVEAEVDPRCARFTIRDEGEGFDCRSLPDPDTPGVLTSGCGRGILMTRLYMDEVKYNEAGNEVTIVRRLAGPDSTASLRP